MQLSPQSAISNQQPATSAKPSALRQSALSLGAALALTFGALAVSGPAAAQPLLAPVVKAGSPQPAPLAKSSVRPSKRTKSMADLPLETAQHSTALCVDLGDPACSGDPEGWSKFWPLNFRFASRPDDIPELEKVTVIGQRSTCYIWMTGVSGEDIPVVLPTCGLGDAMGVSEISSLSPGEFLALEAEVERLAKIVQKCVRASGSRSADSSGLAAMAAAKRDLDGIHLIPNSDFVVVRYSSGEIVTFTFNVIMGGGAPNLINPRPANAEERQVCVVAG